MTKTDARYQDHPKGTLRCKGCTMFREPDKCTLVAGKIAPQGYCVHYDSKVKK